MHPEVCLAVAGEGQFPQPDAVGSRFFVNSGQHRFAVDLDFLRKPDVHRE
jgi:hypothetical protein